MFFDLLKLLLNDGSRGVAPCQPLDPSLTTRGADALLPQATGCHLVAENPGHPAFLSILDTTVDATAMSLRDKVAAAAGGRTPPSPHSVHVPEWPFRRRHLGQSETWRQRECFSSDLERLAPGRLVARGQCCAEWRQGFWLWFHPLALEWHSLESKESAGARDGASADVFALQSQGSRA
jgi:hypothetical protein